MVDGSQSTTCGKTMISAVVRTIAIIRMLVPVYSMVLAHSAQYNIGSFWLFHVMFLQPSRRSGANDGR